MGTRDDTYPAIQENHDMAQQTKAQRSEAVKKAAATRQRNKASDAGTDAKNAAKQAAAAGGVPPSRWDGP